MAMTFSLCDEELEHLEVLEHIIEAKGSLSGCSLLDLRDKQKVFALCDRLIEDDRMQLASELAKKCGVPADMILGELALSLLDLGLYAEAKAELQSVLERKRDGPGGRDHSSLLTQVLERLDTRRPLRCC
jgi:hypothetical protein